MDRSNEAALERSIETLTPYVPNYRVKAET